MDDKKGITKQFIISQTILYVVILAFIIIFKAIFGDENTLIGVTTITAMLMFMGTNLTISPGKNTVKLLAINLLTGISAYLATLNMWTAIPINFITMFILSYSFYYNLKNPLYLPFSLQYLFLLATPVTAQNLPLRLVSLLVGPIIIMVLQLILNKDKITKIGNKIICSICDDIIKKIENSNEEDKKKINIYIKKNITEFKKIVYDNRKDNFYITEEGRIKLDIVVALEKLSILIDKKFSNDFNELRGEVLECLRVLKENFNKEENINKIIDKIHEIISEYENKEIKGFIVLEFLNTLNLLSDSLEELKSLGKENYNNIKSSNGIPEKYKMVNIHKREFYRKSIKFSYAIRVSLGITLAAFISDYFKIAEGRWIYFTILSIAIPIYELSKQKIKDRIFATVVGGVIIIVLFSIFKGSLSRTIILMLSGYFKNYTTSYRYGTIYTTVSAVGAAALLGGAVVFTLDRILLVLVGAIIAVLLNKFIFPIKMQDANRELEQMYSDAINEMLKEVYDEVNDKNNNSHEIDNLLMVTSLIEERFASNNNALISKEEAEYLNDQRLLVVNIHELYTLVSKRIIKESDKGYIIEDLQLLVNYEKENIQEIIKRVEEHIIKAETISDKFILINIREIFNELFEVNKLKERLSL